MEDVLKERGVFWWAGTKIPDGHYAPEDSVAGTLTIDNEGSVRIELDGMMSGDDHPMQMFDPLAPGRMISGLLKATDRHILAEGIDRNSGRRSSHGISYDGFVARYCYVSDQPLPNGRKVRRVIFSLKGYEGWLRLRNFDVKQTKRSLSVKYRERTNVVYATASGRVVLSEKLDKARHGPFGEAGIDLHARAQIEFTPRASVGLKGAVDLYGRIHELILLLTNSTYQPPWPVFVLTNGQRSTCYFGRYKSDAAAPAFHECPIPFPAIREAFGTILSNWMLQRARLGSGAYLYIATRNAHRIYLEHQFNNAVTGLEELHRALTGDPEPADLAARLARILSDIKDSDDRKWLEKRIKYLGKPSLEERLIAVLSSVPSDIAPKKLRAFCAACARIRNHIAHRGRSSEYEEYGQTLQSLHLKSEVIMFLYHAKLLLEIGVPEPLVAKWVGGGGASARGRWFLEKEGLISSRHPP